MHSNRGALGIVIKSASSFVILGSGKSKILVVRISMGLSLNKLLKWEDNKNSWQMTGSLKLQLGLRQH